MFELKVIFFSLLFIMHVSILGCMSWFFYKLTKDFYCVSVILIGIVSLVFLSLVNENGQILSLMTFIPVDVYCLFNLSKWMVDNYGEKSKK